MTERELRLLLRDLEVVERRPGEGQAIRAAVEGTQLSLERFRVVLADATAVLVELHARETLARLPRVQDLKPERRAWFEGALKGLRECVQGQFAQRGGELVFTQSLRLVQRYRAQFEKVLFESLRLEGQPILPPEGKKR